MRVEILDRPDAAWERAERDLEGHGVVLPLRSRLAWARARAWADHRLVIAYGEGGDPLAAFAVEALPSRALPGHRVMRAERVGGGVPPAAAPAMLAALLEHARADARNLRLHVELFSRSTERRAALARALAGAGFASVPPRSYAATLAVDLAGSEAEILASFSKKTRRDLAAAAKLPLAVRSITDVALAPRIDELHRTSIERTGGTTAGEPWESHIAMSSQNPALSRIVGLFRADAAGPEGLVAFAWGCHDGDHAHYDAAGSARAADLKVPLVYPLLWDLICWSRTGAAPWFDLGGVTLGTAGGDDPLGGISDFKRWFSRELVHVGEEWSVDLNPLRARLARAIGAAARYLKPRRPARVAGR